jgi:ketol-acid reductoisomerase
MRRVLREIVGGDFAAERSRELDRGEPRLRELLEAEAAHPMEEAGRRVRRALGGGPGGVDSADGET